VAVVRLVVGVGIEEDRGDEGAGLIGFEDPGLSQGLGGEIRLMVPLVLYRTCKTVQEQVLLSHRNS
jgi:hypothetical protein